MTPRQVAAGMMLVLSSLAGAKAQTSNRTSKQTPAPSQQPITAAPPQRIVELEGNGCAATSPDYPIVWTFDGLKGEGKFDISRQEIDIDSFDGHTLVLRRTSYSGGQIGSGPVNGTAIYTGHIAGTHIAGTASYHPVNGPTSEGPWCGEIENPKVLMPESLAAKQLPKTVPPQILECELDQHCDGVWTFNGSSGNALWPRNPNVTADLTVDSFTPDKIVIRRKDTAPNEFSAIYTGKLDGNRISGNVEAHAGAKTATYNWTATIPTTSCTRTDGLKADTQEAIEVGRVALQFNLPSAALDCYLIAAKNGNYDAQNTVAVLYFQGDSGIKQDYAQSFYWIKQSAAQGNYFAEKVLAKMYKTGRGTEVDLTKAQYWSDKAAASPEAQAIAQDDARQAQVQTMFNAFAGILAGVLDDSDSPGAGQQQPMNDAYHDCLRNSSTPSACTR